MNPNSKDHSQHVHNGIERRFWHSALCIALILSATLSQAATFTVGSTADNGPGSLRDAIASATNGDIINFFLQTPATITLTSGALTVTQSVTIVGPGPGSLTIVGNGTNAVFNFSGGLVGISGLTITNGQNGIYCNAGGLVTISNVVSTGNAGSGIYSTGADLIILDSTVSSNSGGGIFFQPSYSGTKTLAITNTAVIGNINGGGVNLANNLGHAVATMFGVNITGNQAIGAGGGIYNHIDSLNINNSVISSNLTFGSRVAADTGGGGIYNMQAGFTLANSTMIGNATSGSGGAIYENAGTTATLTGVNLIGNSAGAGGALANVAGGFTSGANSTLFNCVMSSNSASVGGAIYNSGSAANVSVKVFSSTLSFNWATNAGGAIYSKVFGDDEVIGPGGTGYNTNNPSGYVELTGCTLNGNVAPTGGAIYSFGGPEFGYPGVALLGITSSTFSNNAAITGGAIYNFCSAPPPPPNNGTASAGVQISTSTFAGNTATNGGLIFNTNSGTGSAFVVIGNSTFYDGSFGGTIQNSGGTVQIQPPASAFAFWQYENFGCTNCPQAAPTADPDGDGANNMAEFLAGTNPNNPASVFRVLGVARQGDDLLVTWQTAGGYTNVVQTSGNLANGFSDISTIVIPGTGDATNTYLATGAALGGTNRFYRIRVGP